MGLADIDTTKTPKRKPFPPFSAKSAVYVTQMDDRDVPAGPNSS